MQFTTGPAYRAVATPPRTNPAPARSATVRAGVAGTSTSPGTRRPAAPTARRYNGGVPAPIVARVDPRLRAAAFHEVGHAVLATVLGGRIHRAVLTPDDPATAGHCSYDDLPAAHDPAITYAGSYAECFGAVGGPPTVRKVRDTLRRNHQDHASLVAAGDPRPAEVPRIVGTCWEAIDGLARLLYRDMTISQANVDAALGLPDGERDPEAREHALAAIRAGSIPGTFAVTSPGLTDWKL